MAMKKKFPRRAALVACNGGCRKSKEEPTCSYGCTGCGKCAEACRFGAVAVSADGVAEVDESRCVACGACVRACPQQIIHLHDCANWIAVKCSNRDRGADARKECAVSCVGCGACQRICTAGAIRVLDNCAVLDESLCLSCGMCAVKCPRKVIHDLRGILTAKD